MARTSDYRPLLLTGIGAIGLSALIAGSAGVVSMVHASGTHSTPRMTTITISATPSESSPDGAATGTAEPTATAVPGTPVPGASTAAPSAPGGADQNTSADPGSGNTAHGTSEGQTGPETYDVQPGDTLASISRNTGVSVDAIANANNLRNVNVIYAGSSLIIPR